MQNVAEFAIDAFRGVVVHRHLGPLFDCRRNVMKSGCSILDVTVKTRIESQFYVIAKVGAFHPLTP